METLPLAALVGPAYVIDVTSDTNVTAAYLEGAPPPADAARLLFKTQNSRRRLMERTAFASDYVGLDSGAAAWLAKHRPGVQLVGVDYLSVGMLEDIVETHRALFRAVRGAGPFSRAAPQFVWHAWGWARARVRSCAARARALAPPP